MTRRAAAILAIVLMSACGWSAGGTGGSGAPIALTVFAAASLQPPFDRIGAQVLKTKGIKVTFNYAGSQTLTAQLTEGAQADVFASADLAHMTTVQNAGLVAGTTKTFAHNRLEIAVAKGNPKGIHSLADLSRQGLVVVLADPSVPAGKYAQQALAKAGVQVKPASLELEVTAVLNKVAFGEADAGIVYSSDVSTSGRVDGVPIPDDQNVIASYPIAVLHGSAQTAAARDFVTYVLSPDGQAILKEAGFQPA